MKRFLILSVLFSLLPAVSLLAQKKKWNDQPYKYEVTFGWAPSINGYEFFDSPHVYHGSLDALYAEQYGSAYTFGGLAAEYGLNFRKWFTLGFNLSASGAWRDVYDPLTSVTGRRSAAIISVMPVARFLWVRTTYVRMYSSIGAGVYFCASSNEFSADAAVCIVPVGMQIGRKIFGFMETGGGIGCNMLGVKAGIGVKF